MAIKVHLTNGGFVKYGDDVKFQELNGLLILTKAEPSTDIIAIYKLWSFVTTGE